MDHIHSPRVAPGQALYHAWLEPLDNNRALHTMVSSILSARNPAEVLSARRDALNRLALTWGPWRHDEASDESPEDSDWGRALNAITAAALEMLRLQNLCADRSANLETTLERLKEAQEAANTDALTGLPNRRSFLEQAQRQLSVSLRYGAPFTLLLLDVDHFKACNDSFGHAAGDVVLKQLARTLAAEIRDADFAARYGGEEFTVLCPNTDTKQAVPLAQRLREAIQDTLLMPEHPEQSLPSGMTVSIGIATHEPRETEVDAVLARADAALYAAKRAGRNRIEMA